MKLEMNLKREDELLKNMMIYIVEQKKNRKQEKYYTELLYKLFYLNLLFFKIKINN